MYKLALITTITLLGCGCTKANPSYTTKAEGQKLADTLTSCMEIANKLTDKVSDHEARLTALETHSLAQSDGTGSLFVLNTRAETEPVSTTRPPRTPYVNQPSVTSVAQTTANNNAPGALPEDELAIKFGKFKQETEEHFIALEENQTKQDHKLAQHSGALEHLTTQVKKLTETVDVINQSTQSLKRDLDSLRSPRTLAEAPAPR